MWPRGLFSLGEFMNNFNAQIKPALTFNQQLDHLISDKGLIVNNYDNALSILKHENYYRLSGYMIDFLDKNDNFIDNISFEDIYNVYKTDKEIRSTLFELINDIEVYLKTQLANYFSLTYGPVGYLDPSNFNFKNHQEYIDIIDFLKRCGEVNKRNASSLIIQHHNNKYNGFVPVWALVELIPLGIISKFYSLLKTKDKKAILKIGYNDISYEKLESFYHCVSYLRNQCCHYQRLYRKNHPIKPKLYTPSNINLGSFVSGSTYSLVLPLLYINPNQSLGKRAIEKLKNIERNSKVDFVKNYGFEANWKNNLYLANGHCVK